MKIIVVLLSVLISLPAWSWTSQMGHIGTFMTQTYTSHLPTVLLKDTRSFDQQQSEECYLFAFTASVEVANANGWNRNPAPQISAEYLFVQKLLAWAKDSLTNNSGIDDTFYWLIGGEVHHAMKLSVEEGLLPQQLFHPNKNYADWNTEELYANIRELVRGGRDQMRSAKTASAKKEIYDTVINQVKSRIAREAGDFTPQFIFNGKTYNVDTFEDNYGIKPKSHIYMIYPKGMWDMGSPYDLRKAVVGLTQTFNGAFNFRVAEWGPIFTYMIRSLDQGLPVMLSMKWQNSYHVMVAVGYEYNEKNEVVSFKLKNSWGDVFGDHGYAFFDPVDLQKHVTTVWGYWAP